jgi:hypothetical protein
VSAEAGAEALAKAVGAGAEARAEAGIEALTGTGADEAMNDAGGVDVDEWPSIVPLILVLIMMLPVATVAPATTTILAFGTVGVSAPLLRDVD